MEIVDHEVDGIRRVGAAIRIARRAIPAKTVLGRIAWAVAVDSAGLALRALGIEGSAIIDVGLGPLRMPSV